MFESYQQDNGARVILAPQADTRAVTVLVMYPVGSRYEPEKLSGVSHYIEHLMFKGTKRRPTTLTLTREIDRLGAEYNAFTSKEYTGYYIKIDSEYADTAMDILSDMLGNSLFDPKEMEREKGPIIEELRMYRDNPIMNIENVFEELLYSGPLGRDIGGTPEHVRSFRRDEVLSYRNAFYAASNMTIVVAGRIGGNARERIASYFGAPGGRRKPVKRFAPGRFGSAKKQDRLSVQEKIADQAQVMLGFPGFPYAAAENPAVSVMNTILGGSMSSRLFIQIRERRGLAYSISSGDEHFRDLGHAFVRMGVDPGKMNKALAVVMQEISKLTQKGVTARELADAKTHIRGAVALAMEDSSAQANWYAKEALFYPAVKTPMEKIAAIERVTREEVLGAAKKIFRMNEMRIAVIGDVKKDAIAF